MRHTTPVGRATAVGVAALIALTACQSEPRVDTSTGPLRLNAALVSFDSCDEAEAELRDATVKHINETGFGVPVAALQDEAMAAESKVAPPPDSREFSGTNVQEVGIDEPDVVKTDGDRVVAIDDGTLYVVSAATREITGSLDLGPDAAGDDATIMWHEDRVLVIHHRFDTVAPTPDKVYSGGGTALTLVDISGAPTVVDEYAIDGVHLDSRSRDGIVRVVVRSTPIIPFEPAWFFEDELDAAHEAIMETSIDAWLPDYELNGEEGQVGCRSLARPTSYSGSSTMTILSFNLADGLDDGSPLTLAADGDTVYGTADALYIANDQTRFTALMARQPSGGDTEIFRFAIDGPALRYHSDVTVDGYLLNRYALSEWDGHLRVATTMRAESNRNGEPSPSSSSVQVFAVEDDTMTPVGRVDGLGVDERIFAVRYIGATAYVVTFRETDPLYVVDLSDPTNPVAVGELKIPGYSAYLHPIGDGRLIGVGQNADQNGTVLGTQVSLFDVSDPTAPERLDAYTEPSSQALVENDPHAFLYWEGTVVLPIQFDGDGRALRLRIDGDTITPLDAIRHRDGSVGPFRAFAIDKSLWTMSDLGLLVAPFTGTASETWIPFG